MVISPRGGEWKETEEEEEEEAHRHGAILCSFQTGRGSTQPLRAVRADGWIQRVFFLVKTPP